MNCKKIFKPENSLKKSSVKQFLVWGNSSKTQFDQTALAAYALPPDKPKRVTRLWVARLCERLAQVDSKGWVVKVTLVFPQSLDMLIFGN